MLVVGSIAFAILVAQPILAHTGDEAGAEFEGLDELLLRLTGWSILVTLVSGLLWLWLVAANMSGRPLGEALQGDAIGIVLTRTNFGRVWELRLALVALLSAYFLLLRNRLRIHRGWAGFRTGAAVLGACLLMSLAGAGHAAGTDLSVRLLHLASDAVHLLAGGVWLGALVPLAYVLGQVPVSATGSTLSWEVSRRFSALGMASVGGVLATGIVNAWLLVGRLPALFDTAYGRLLLLKIALFGIMVGIAAINRFHLSPRLHPGGSEGAEREAAQRLRQNAIAELVLGGVIVLIVGALGTMVPPPHVHHH